MMWKKLLVLLRFSSFTVTINPLLIYPPTIHFLGQPDKLHLLPLHSHGQDHETGALLRIIQKSKKEKRKQIKF